MQMARPQRFIFVPPQHTKNPTPRHPAEEWDLAYKALASSAYRGRGPNHDDRNDRHGPSGPHGNATHRCSGHSAGGSNMRPHTGAGATRPEPTHTGRHSSSNIRQPRRIPGPALAAVARIASAAAASGQSEHQSQPARWLSLQKSNNSSIEGPEQGM